jgi:hypothetical protein
MPSLVHEEHPRPHIPAYQLLHNQCGCATVVGSIRKAPKVPVGTRFLFVRQRRTSNNSANTTRTVQTAQHILRWPLGKAPDSARLQGESRDGIDFARSAVQPPANRGPARYRWLFHHDKPRALQMLDKPLATISATRFDGKGGTQSGTQRASDSASFEGFSA